MAERPIDIRRVSPERPKGVEAGYLPEELKKKAEELATEIPDCVEREAWSELATICAVCHEIDPLLYTERIAYIVEQYKGRFEEERKEGAGYLLRVINSPMALLGMMPKIVWQTPDEENKLVELLREESELSFLREKNWQVFTVHTIVPNFFEKHDVKNLTSHFEQEFKNMLTQGRHSLSQNSPLITRALLNNAVAIHLLDKELFDREILPLLSPEIWSLVVEGVERESWDRKIHRHNALKQSQYMLMLKYLSDVLYGTTGVSHKKGALPTVRNY